MIKRIMDILGGALGLLILIIITPCVGAAIFVEDGWPVFIKQRRVSRGRIINVWKFRSMVKDAERKKEDLREKNERNDGPFFKITNDPRITRVGKFLRKTRIDEFPQFINVLKGEISLVGPRPHEPEEILEYPEQYKCLALEKGGITCLSQITGEPYLPFEQEMELDIHYAKNRSLWMDVKVIAKTTKILLTDRNGI